MNVKSSVATIATELEKLREHVEDARKALDPGRREMLGRALRHARDT
jgi:hypothetical protein